MFNLGPVEIIIIFIVALIVLGPQRLPEIARALGKAIGEFKRATIDLQSSFDAELRSSSKAYRPPVPASTRKQSAEERPSHEHNQHADSSEEIVKDGHLEAGAGELTKGEENQDYDR